MKIFVTGASGFVGGAIAKELISKKHTVLALSRSETSDQALRSLGAQIVRGSLGSVDPSLLQGVDAIVHCAAFVGPWGTRKDFWEANVEGTRQLLKAAETAGVKRFVHMGTEAALFNGQNMIGIDETYPYPKSTPYLYSETKGAAERAVLAANSKTFQTLSLRPRFVWGPGDTSILPVLLKMVSDGKFLWIDGGKAKTSTTYIGNLVHATELALTKGNGGNAYFVTDGFDQPFRSFLTEMMRTQGVELPSGSIPSSIAGTLAWIVEGVWRLFGIRNEPPLMRFATDIMGRECTIRIDKARKELGYEPIVDVASGLKAMKAPA